MRSRATVRLGVRLVVVAVGLWLYVRLDGWWGFLALVVAFFAVPSLVAPLWNGKDRRGPRTPVRIVVEEPGPRLLEVIKVIRAYNDAPYVEVKQAVLDGVPIELQVPESEVETMRKRLITVGARFTEQLPA